MECMYTQTRLDLGLYSHPKEFFLGNGVRSHVTSKERVPSTGDPEEDGIRWLWIANGCLLVNNNNNNNNNDNRIQRRNSRCFTISSLHREPSPTRTLNWPGRSRVQNTCNTSSAYHVQHVVLRATWYEGTAQLLSLVELKSHFFELYCWLNH